MREIEEAILGSSSEKLVGLVRETGCPAFRELRALRTELASNRIRVVLAPPGNVSPCTLAFEEQSGWLVASMCEPGFVDKLEERHRLVLENALVGFYKRGSVNLVREQIEATLAAAWGRTGLAYDIADEGLVVWPDAEHDTEIVYSFDGAGPFVTPEVRGNAVAHLPAPLVRERVFFCEQVLLWADWVAAFAADPPIRLLRLDSVLPPATPPTGV